MADFKNKATVQIDVDSVKHLADFYGYKKDEFNSNNFIYKKALIRFRDLLDDHDIKATFMVVGEDLSNDMNRAILKDLHNRGHEIANHSMHHKFGFRNLGYNKITEEIVEAEIIIREITGEKPLGFRAPGYDVNSDVIDVLEENNYKYDSSVFPSFFNPCLKLFALSKNRKTKTGFGDSMLALAPNRPYYPGRKRIWKKGPERGVLEIPVTTLPYLKIPFYSNFNLLTGKSFFDMSLRFLKNSSCNYVFHTIEFLDRDEIDKSILCKHPNTSLSLDKKMELFDYFLKGLKKNFYIITTRKMAEQFKNIILNK